MKKFVVLFVTSLFFASMAYAVESTTVGADTTWVAPSDAGAEVGYYSADITRTWPTSGHFSREQRILYDLVLKAQDAAIALCRPGVPHIEGFRVAMRILSDGLVMRLWPMTSCIRALI